MKPRTALALVAPLALAAFAVPQHDAPDNAGGQAKIAYTRSTLASLSSVLEEFHKDCGRYPTTREGLAALVVGFTPPTDIAARWKGPYIAGKLPKDSWAHAFWYAATPNGFALASFGADGKPGGTAMDEDLATTP